MVNAPSDWTGRDVEYNIIRMSAKADHSQEGFTRPRIRTGLDRQLNALVQAWARTIGLGSWRITVSTVKAFPERKTQIVTANVDVSIEHRRAHLVFSRQEMTRLDLPDRRYFVVHELVHVLLPRLPEDDVIRTARAILSAYDLGLIDA